MERNRQVSCPEFGVFLLIPSSLISAMKRGHERKGKGRRCQRCFVSRIEEEGHGKERKQQDRGEEDEERLGHE